MKRKGGILIEVALVIELVAGLVLCHRKLLVSERERLQELQTFRLRYDGIHAWTN